MSESSDHSTSVDSTDSHYTFHNTSLYDTVKDMFTKSLERGLLLEINDKGVKSHVAKGHIQSVQFSMPGSYAKINDTLNSVYSEPAKDRGTHEDITQFPEIVDFPQLEGLRKNSRSEIVSYFRSLFGLDKSKTAKVVVTTSSLSIINTFFGPICVYIRRPPKMCDICKCFTHATYSLRSKESDNSSDDSEQTNVCSRCITSTKSDSSDPSTKAFDQYAEGVPILRLTHKCDVCLKSEEVGDSTYSSKTFDVDLCERCAKTENGATLIKQYEMVECVEGKVHSQITTGFSSVLDWVPVYSDDNDYQLAVFLSKDIPITVHQLAIVHKNSQDEFEFTPLDKVFTTSTGILPTNTMTLLIQVEQMLKTKSLKEIVDQEYAEIDMMCRTQFEETFTSADYDNTQFIVMAVSRERVFD
ncbi:hypothetical protein YASMINEVIRUS_1013 [Yasminevirus sp. GU-2018]|uniref:Uncharacterized protein n=1 Tax=Yasminevirus sp. GU-2018 TaxID=2420051 RepID=A0A5K0UA25_9VIRU|nr:hypothetical protein YASMINEVIRUS_1013 [Yasminevirus sp. GU-2018]